ncbi:MAG: 3-hydroxybutyryl-CoA dehydrogenase [Acidobacteriota bacterium]|nr:3-hydroxybutyryl-CoA dehydrogenase [Acidobacteriota bacterium]
MAAADKLAIIGSGTMGAGIAQVAAVSGIEVLIVEVDRKAAETGRQRITSGVQRGVDKGKIPAGERDRILARVRFASTLKEAADADFVVEAAPETEDLKQKIFAELDRECRKDVILASNTSSISITRIAAATGRADRIIGMHFFNPVPAMQLVEIIRAQATSDETFAATRDLAVRMGKTAVEVHDFPGFVSNRVLMPMINEATFALMEGVASAEAIDQVMVLGMNHPMGPLALADLIGLDVCLHTMEVLQRGHGDPKYRPCPLMRRMVDAGHLGRKTGHGFFTYPARAPQPSASGAGRHRS